MSFTSLGTISRSEDLRYCRRKKKNLSSDRSSFLSFSIESRTVPSILLLGFGLLGGDDDACTRHERALESGVSLLMREDSVLHYGVVHAVVRKGRA